MSKKLLAACLVTAAFVVVPALASANPILTEPTGTTMSTGGLDCTGRSGPCIVATNVGVTKLTTPNGNLECSTASLTGRLVSNTTAGGLEAEIFSSAKFGGTGAQVVGAPEPECTGSGFFTPNTTVTPEGSLPWCLRAGAATDKFTFRGGTCAGAQTPITFALDVTGIPAPCKYEREATIEGTISTDGEATNPSTLSIASVNFTGESTNSGLCPTHVELDVTFSLETDNPPTNSPIFISN